MQEKQQNPQKFVGNHQGGGHKRGQSTAAGAGNRGELPVGSIQQQVNMGALNITNIKE